MRELTVPEIQKRKEEALNFYLEHLLAGEGKGLIGKVFLFGSVAKGFPVPESDIDLLIFGLKDIEKIREKCADAALETWIKFSESVEPLIYCMDDFRILNSYFLYKVTHEGKEVHAVEEEELRNAEARAYLDLATEYLEGAKRSHEANDFRISIDAAYNAVELCAKGLLLLKGLSIPRSHGGVVGEFGKEYIKTGVLPDKIGRRFHDALEVRNKARYDVHTRITKETAGEVLDLAFIFVDELQRRLG